MTNTGLLYKLTHMEKGRLLRKLLCFDDVYVTAVRPFRADASLPQKSGERFVPVSSGGRFWYADPALFVRGGKTWLFMEAFDRRLLLGRIACICLEEPGTEPKIVLREPFHLSFPQVFLWNDEVYMIPETGADRSLRLYRAVRFPDEWEVAARFPTECQFADTVIVKKESERLTLLTSELSEERQYYQRYHRMQIETDGQAAYRLREDEAFLTGQPFSYRARNAGGIYRENGEMILPTQESTPTAYGVRLNFVRYAEAETDIFAQPVGSTGPKDVCIEGFESGSPRMFGIHSYARTDRYEVIDMNYMVFTPSKYIRRFLVRHLTK